MSKQLLEIQPKELKFIFELKKQSFCTVQLTNNTDQHVAFKVKTTSPKKYSVRPNVGVLLPRSTCECLVVMQGQREAPMDMVCKDKFLVQSTIIPVGTTSGDITGRMFAKDGGKYVEENKLRVTFINPASSPELSQRNEKPENELDGKDSTLPRIKNLFHEPMVTDYINKHKKINCFKKEHEMHLGEFKHEKNIELKAEKEMDFEPRPEKQMGSKTEINISELNTGKDVEKLEQEQVAELKNWKDIDELKFTSDIKEMKFKLTGLESKLNKAEVTISKLIEERRLNHQETRILQEKLEELNKRGMRKIQVGFPLLYVCMVALICVVLGYHLHC